MKKPELDALTSLLRAVGATPDESRAILGAATGASRAPADKLLKTKEAAVLLEDCHPKTVLRYGKRGLLHPVRRTPRCIRWRESEVLALANGGAK